ncbi:MAG TPA: polysaccharide biosynthesis tyrosine autokinase [Vicinamibacterales bacterium]|nr:polysaccharide biosynthesis tyrosine autokinase [Vicinamibacterales bacterium]
MSDQIDPIDDSPAADAVIAEPAADVRKTAVAVARRRSSEDLDPHEIIRILYRRRWAMATIFAAVVLMTVAHAFTATPVYEARTRLLIESDDPNVVSFKAVVGEGQPNPDYYQTQYGILQSRELARRTIDSLRLWSSDSAGTAPRASIWDRVWPAATTEAPPAQRDNSSEAFTQSVAIDRFLGHLSVEPLRNSRLVDVKFRSADSQLAAQIANQLAKHYIEHSLEYKFTASRDASTWLSEQLAGQRKVVEAAETRLQRYREETDAVSGEDGGNIVVQKLGELNSALTRAKTERMQKEAVERQLLAIEHDPAALDAFPVVLESSYIQRQKAELSDLQRQRAQLADKLGDLHPDMMKINSAIASAQAKVQAEIGNVVSSLHTEYKAAVTQEQSLTKALDDQKREALSMNRKAIDYGVLARDAESSRQVYNSLMQRAKETGVSGELRSSNIRIIDRAEQPRTPVSPNRTLDILLGVVGGLVLAVAFAFFYEYLDDRLKDPDEIRACLGLAPLGMLPALGQQRTTGPLLLNNGVPPNFSEMFRTIRTNILFSSPQGAPRTLAVTSTGPGEGKTLVSSNLAVACALAGQRVLLIDADMRRPQMHDLFDIELSPGLSNIIVGDAKASTALQKTSVSGLWLMPAGRTPPNPVELLGSARFREVLASLSQHFDTIVIDTPPAMVVADPLVVATIASGVVFVVGAEMTSRHTARAVIDQLERGNARILGAVLNRVEFGKNRYYYSRYYGSAYGTYYQTAHS